MAGEARSQPGACTEIANNSNSGVVRHGCRVNESANVDPSDVARPAKLASLLAWFPAFFGMAPGGSGVEAPANGGDRCWP